MLNCFAFKSYFFKSMNEVVKGKKYYINETEVFKFKMVLKVDSACSGDISPNPLDLPED